MPVAWDLLHVPGPPPGFELSAHEQHAAEPLARFHRRTIQLLDCAAGGADRLALVDKAAPHAQFDLMLSEASPLDKPTPDDVLPLTAQALWRTGLELVRFVSEPAQQRAFGLQGGQLHLALNCDPNTLDRESVQAAKQFHLHLLYWTADELAPLSRWARLGSQNHPVLHRQLLDPLSFLGAHLLVESLADMPLGIPGAVLLPGDDAAVAAGRRPLGCLIRLPGWHVLAEPAFEDLIRRLHRRLARIASALLDAFTGCSTPPSPWQRHRLRPPHERRERIRALGYSPLVTRGLLALAAGLRDLSAPATKRLRLAAPPARMHCMTLNQPCYALNLYAPRPNGSDAPLIEADQVYLILQTKLFSGTGGAGLLTLNGIPSVRVLRGSGRYTEAQWRRRAEFQHAFALFNSRALSESLGLGCVPVRRLLDFEQGWA